MSFNKNSENDKHIHTIVNEGESTIQNSTEFTVGATTNALPTTTPTTPEATLSGLHIGDAEIEQMQLSERPNGGNNRQSDMPNAERNADEDLERRSTFGNTPSAVTKTASDVSNAKEEEVACVDVLARGGSDAFASTMSASAKAIDEKASSLTMSPFTIAETDKTTSAAATVANPSCPPTTAAAANIQTSAMFAVMSVQPKQQQQHESNNNSNSNTGAIQLTHISSDERSFTHQHQLTAELPRNQQQQQQKMKSYHDTKQSAMMMWSKESLLGSLCTKASSSSDMNASTAIISYRTITGCHVKSGGTTSVTVSPCLVRKGSDPCGGGGGLPRRVSFPKSDSELVTGYLEPANPWGQACLVKSISEIAELYVMSCRKHKTKPLQTVLDHLKGVELNKQQRQPILSLKSIKLAASDCEALEEIFKRVQYKLIDLSSCELDEWATSALFEMIEYYEAAHELDISSNSKGMTTRGWSGCMAMVKHSEELRVLIAQGNPISKQSADGLGQAICTSNLHTLKLEHCGLRGALDGLCFKLRHNTTLKELWLAHNDLDYRDAESLGDLLKVNHYIELIDISNNNIRDQGLLYIVEALILQSQELERRSMLQRSSAIDDDDSLSSLEASQTTDFDMSSDSFSNNSKNSEADATQHKESADKVSEQRHVEEKVSADVLSTATPTITTTTSNTASAANAKVIGATSDKVPKDSLLLHQEKQAAQQQDVITTTTSTASATTTNAKLNAVGSGIGVGASTPTTVDDMDGDDDTEDTVKSSNQKNGSNAHSGKSMLDKLLSMNSESSSEEGASNLSTDTIAACGDEDVSITSDDIFETSLASTTTTPTSAAAGTTETGTAACGTTTDSHKNSNSNVNMKANAEGTLSSVHIITNEETNEGNLQLSDVNTSETDAASTTYDNSNNSNSNDRDLTHGNSHIENISRSPPLSNSETSSNNNTTTSGITSHTESDEEACRRKYKESESLATCDQDNQNQNVTTHQQQQQNDAPNASNVGGVFEVTAGEGDCTIAGGGDGGAPVVAGGGVAERSVATDQHTPSLLQHQQQPTKAMDVNKNTKLTDDYDDTHSTDSAFESASEGDISRHLPEEYSRISTSFDGDAPIDDMVKGVAIETGTIATESIEYLADAGATPTTPPSLRKRELAASLSALDGDIEASCQTITPNTTYTAHTYTSVVKTEATAAGTETETKAITGNDEKSATAQIATSETEAAVNLPTTASTSPPALTTAATTTATTATTTTAATSQISTSIAEREEEDDSLKELPALPKVTIASDTLMSKDKEELRKSPIPTPPPPSTSPGGASHGMRRTESSAAFITPATRHRSQSSDSLCSDNSLDGSTSSELNFSTSSQLNEKLTKNDTLTRQQRQLDPRPSETTTKAPGGLKALALWNNNLSRESGYYISHLLSETNSLELLNIGKNCLSNDFVNRIKDSLIRNTTLTTLGLQSAHLSANGIETLASILTFGGNSTLQRLDIRDNKLEVESLTKIAEVLKSNTTLTQIDIDDEPKRLSVGSEAHMDYTRVLENVRSMCSRNEKTQAQLHAEKSHSNGGSGAGAGKRRSGYYLGSRKISLTCHTRPLVEPVMATSNTTTPTTPSISNNNNKLDPKRKTGARLRSPVPSPPTISPSSSPNRSRFQVFRVTESSPLTSPLAQTPPSETSSSSSLATTNSNSSSVSMPADMPYRTGGSSGCGYMYGGSIYGSTTSLPTSSSLPSMMMATMTSSTQSIKRYSTSPRSRFLVSKIYEDPRVPLASRSLPPLTPPIHLPPTPMAKHAPSSAKLSLFSEDGKTKTTTSVEIDCQATCDTATAGKHVTTAITSRSSIAAETTTTTLLVTPPSPAILETSGSGKSESESGNDSSTNMPELNLQQAVDDTTNAKEQKEKEEEVEEQRRSQIQMQPEKLKEGDAQVITTSQPTNPPTQSDNNNALAPSSSASSSSTASAPSSSSSTSSSSSSSSSTSPASLQSSSSATSSSSTSSTTTSSQISAIFSNSSTDSIDGVAVIGFGSGSSGPIGSELSLREELLNAAGTTARCPLAVFNANDNDITLTKNLANELTAPAPAPVAAATTSTSTSTSTASASVDESQQQRQRKVSWIANPGAVDKLRSLFFQRSSSPETHALAAASGAVPSQPQQPSAVTNSATSTTVAVNSNALAFNLADCTLSDASSQQLLQKFVHASQHLSKVFRQNLSFGNESAAAAATAAIAGSGAAAGNLTLTTDDGNRGASGNLPTNEQCDVTLIPTEMKQEIKENISPEHTINEGTLHSYQKLADFEGAAAAAAAAAARFMQEQQQQQQQQQQQPSAGASLEHIEGMSTTTILSDEMFGSSKVIGASNLLRDDDEAAAAATTAVGVEIKAAAST